MLKLPALAGIFIVCCSCAPRAQVPGVQLPPAQAATIQMDTGQTAPAQAADPPAPAQTASPASAYEAQLFARINDLRAQGYACPSGWHPAVGALTYANDNAAAARQQALYMAATGKITHTGADGSSPRVRAASYGVRALSVSEIIYLNAGGPFERAVQWWLHSAVHCDVLMNARYAYAGAAVVPGVHGTASVMVFSGSQAPK